MNDYLVPWLITGVVFAVILFALGWRLGAGHHLLGILVDDKRKRVSLAKFQLVAWTVVIMSAFAVLMIDRHSVEIYLSAEVWGLLGISVSSMAGAAVIKGAKLDTQPAAAQNVAAFGVLANTNQPRFSDIFMGDELDNQDIVDFSKVQMFFLTLIAIVGYIYAMYHYPVLVKPEGFEDTYDAYFPELSSSLLTILAISHAGYLTVKAAPHTRTK